MKSNNLFAHLKSDVASGLVVFLVALPLCLGIALASGAPLFAGIISGIIGGIVVGFLSQSHISVSGPAAGLTALVFVAIADLGYEAFLVAVVLAGAMQFVLGLLKAGTISNYFPSSVIEGMLAGIGIIILIQQIPLALGSDVEVSTGFGVFADLFAAFQDIKPGILVITAASLAVLIIWDKVPALKKLKLVPGALVAVSIGILINGIFILTDSPLVVTSEYLVSLPVPTSFEEFKSIFAIPSYSAILNPGVWVVAITITIVASIETLLCIEATERLDSLKRFVNTNVELKAQGIGNIISGVLGGLPMTSVVVRSSANASAGAKTKMSAIVHGLLLLISVLSIPTILNMIPMATLAAILLLIGYKLANPASVKHFWKRGKYQFIPFIVTVLAVVFLGLLNGVALGMIMSIIFILRGNIKKAYFFRKEEYLSGDVIHVDLAQEVSFLNKAAIKLTLYKLPNNSKVIIDASDTVYIAQDVLDLINEFKMVNAEEKGIDLVLVGFKKAYRLENDIDSNNKVYMEKRVLKEEKFSELFQD
ncbi:MFS superfamily sulfate permease-like transporter [Algoriphagus ratkowskyi]|uniref:MFS superfamily sulfate permease-like transporter n=1 Tax=Algoriphagus ratkowskyi TaxID=57028 RepID=A0A2W7R4Y8_9BACT|nr:SulP family inorganic anion transporter [Algoriphagus ratkowskyi]PZX55933.1 MFS superfamily sulfate permease-like transporter [Algoriphagus ratkowskyi]TXD77253.1 SulP family inorganic anion transporter [Algoriphagus ratkowskyi]